MIQIQKAVFNLIIITCFLATTTNAQKTKTHTERFTVNENVSIDVNTTHTNVEFETWDKNEVEITFTLEADENVEEQFKKWDFEATANKSKVNIESQSSHYFDVSNFQYDFEDFSLKMEDLDLDLKALDIDLSNLNLDVENMVSGVLLDLNLDDIPPSPFGKDVSFNSDKYEKNPEKYLNKLNNKHDTKVTQKEMDQWIDELTLWSENIETKIDLSKDAEMEGIEEYTKEIQETIEKWEKENGEKLKEMTDKIEEQVESIDFKKYENFNHFDQDRSNIKKTIRIKLPKKAKLNLNIRYGEVTLAENLRNINADLNYATLSANTINGKSTDISASYAPVFVDHWRDGHLKLNHCHDIKIKKATTIDINAQGTDIVIGTLLNSGLIRSAYGDLEIQKLGENLKSLNLVVDYGKAILYLPSNAMDLTYSGNQQSVFSLPKKCKIISDSNQGKSRTIKAYNQKQNSGKLVSVLTKFGDVTIK